ncbi:MAG: DNA repair protein RecN [Alphaproteobacteria bacterium]|nr:DNA repair protein RecN [Alphaproteobacteria bacterium]
MLAHLSIRDIVLIDKLDLGFGNGLTAMTGETGAGKSILLDALTLAMGGRSASGLVRAGAERGSVTALLSPPPDHSSLGLLGEQGIETDGDILIRRVVSPDGRSRAFINDTPASVGLLKTIGDSLIEIQGQFDNRGLMDPSTHRLSLDAFARLLAAAADVGKLHKTWREAETALERARENQARAAAERGWLEHAVNEIDAIGPQEGEEEKLDAERRLLANAEAIADGINDAVAALTGERGVDGQLAKAQGVLTRAAAKAGDRFEPVIETLDRATVETQEAIHQLQALAADLDADPGRADQVEERLFALRDLARKHGVIVDDLPRLQQELAQKLALITGGAEALADLELAAREAKRAYQDAAQALSDKRKAAAAELDRAIMAELPPLKLERARFRTRIDRLPEEKWGASGLDAVVFEVATNPGAAPGPLSKIASGGELARFLLAFKVVLHAGSGIGTLVFDEVDAGIGGATASAVGDRLARLGQETQVLVVTHSPQVAARAAGHFRVEKTVNGGTTATSVRTLTPDDRREEIARMLAGATITEEARAAADRLLEHPA